MNPFAQAMSRSKSMAVDLTNPNLTSGYRRYLPLTRRVEHRGVAMCRLSGRTLTSFGIIQDEEPSHERQLQLEMSWIAADCCACALLPRRGQFEKRST